MDFLVIVQRRTFALLVGLIADGALPPNVDLGRFSVRMPRAGAPGDVLVDAALVYARDAASVGSAPRDIARALADGLGAIPEAAAAEVAGGGLVVVTLHPRVILAAVAAILGEAAASCTASPGRADPAPRAPWPGPAEVAAPLVRARCEVLADILASLARAAGRPAAPEAEHAAGLAPVAPVVLRGRLPGIGAAPAVAGAALAGIGEDSFRFAVASRRRDAVLDLDLAVLGDRSRVDPAFWVAFAHARARATLRRAAAVLPDLGLCPAALAAADLPQLMDGGEMALARLVARHGTVVAGAAAAAAPHTLAAHLREVADAVHSQWNRSKDQPQLRFVNEEQRDLTKARLALVTASALVLKSGLDIFGIAAPDEMR